MVEEIWTIKIFLQFLLVHINADLIAGLPRYSHLLYIWKKKEDDDVEIPLSNNSNQQVITKKSRDPSLRVRYRVLTRDNYSCKLCGNSPAKDLGIKLHIDHVVPWSKGGETNIENLQTLCDRCNLGKSDLL